MQGKCFLGTNPESIMMLLKELKCPISPKYLTQGHVGDASDSVFKTL